MSVYVSKVVCACDSKDIVLNTLSLKGVSYIVGSAGMQAFANAK